MDGFHRFGFLLHFPFSKRAPLDAKGALVYLKGRSGTSGEWVASLVRTHILLISLLSVGYNQAYQTLAQYPAPLSRDVSSGSPKLVGVLVLFFSKSAQRIP